MSWELRSSIPSMTYSGTMFCLVDAPDKYVVERHHAKFGMKYDWITPVKMTARYEGSDQTDE
jgi:hypothetical protein